MTTKMQVELGLDDPVVLDSGTIRVGFTYPLTNPVIVEFTRPQWTIRDFVEAVVEQYGRLYQEEAAGTRVPVGRVPGLLNRNRTNGPYGIWGHDLSDLILCGFEKKNGVYELHIES